MPEVADYWDFVVVECKLHKNMKNSRPNDRNGNQYNHSNYSNEGAFLPITQSLPLHQVNIQLAGFGSKCDSDKIF